MDNGLFSIVGVMPPQFVFWDRSLWMPLTLDPSEPRTARRYYVQAQLRPGITARDAESRLGLFTTRLGRDNPDVAEYAGLTVTLNSLVDDVLRDLRPTLYGLLAAVALVLFVAAANLANAMLAKGLAREGELALRRALGASRGRIARQLLIESSLISVAGAAVGASLASFLLPYVVSLVPYGYVPAEARIEMDWRVLMFAVAISILSGVLIGLVPAERAARIEPGTLLQRSNFRTGLGRTHAWRRVFVTAQVTMAIVMIGLALAAFESVRAVVGRYPGFDPGQLWTAAIALPADVSSDSARAAVYERVLQQLRETPGVTDVALTSVAPIGDLPRVLVSRELADQPQGRATVDADVLVISPEFTRLLRIPIAGGRSFEQTDNASARPVGLISDNLAERLWPGVDAVGRLMVVNDGPTTTSVTVVGVVGNITANPADVRQRPTLLVPMAQRPTATAVLTIRSADPQGLLPAVRHAMAAVDPRMPVFLPEMLRQTRVSALGPQLLAVTLLAIFGMSVLIVSALGVHAVINQSVLERRHELSIRLALGAEPRQLFLRELAGTAKLLMVSGAIGAVVAAVMLRLLSTTFLRFHASTPGTLASAIAVVATVAIGAAILPAYRASRSDVLASLAPH
jgi:putative ABC transport system permease protein